MIAMQPTTRYGVDAVTFLWALSEAKLVALATHLQIKETSRSMWQLEISVFPRDAGKFPNNRLQCSPTSA